MAGAPARPDAFPLGRRTSHGEASPGDTFRRSTTTGSSATSSSTAALPGVTRTASGPEAKAQSNFSGWPYGILFWPLGAVFGLVGGWNVLQLLFYALAGLAACAWLRELGLPRGPAVAGGLAFAIAPYRVEQSVGHLLGPISILLPLSLWAFERARRGVAGGSRSPRLRSHRFRSRDRCISRWRIPFFLGYAFCRTPDRRLLLGAGAGAVAAIGAGLVVRQTVIERSTQSSGRSLDEIRFYSADFGDFVSRHVDHARSEQFVFLAGLPRWSRSPVSSCSSGHVATRSP